VRRGYDEVMKAWRDAPARRAAAPWPAELDRELAALRDPVAALGRADAKQRATVAPAADVVRRQVDRVRAIVEDHETELPRAMVEGWTRLSRWVRDLGK
jgi:predicted nucleic acid-binding Zn ribbon protein